MSREEWGDRQRRAARERGEVRERRAAAPFGPPEPQEPDPPGAIIGLRRPPETDTRTFGTTRINGQVVDVIVTEEIAPGRIYFWTPPPWMDSRLTVEEGL